MSFFEGNDLDDLDQGIAIEEEFLRSGRRPLREITPQSSLLLAIGDLIGSFSERDFRNETTQRFLNADLKIGTKSTVVTVRYNPPNWSELADNSKSNLVLALRKWKETAIQNGMIPWLVYMPCDHRIYSGNLTFRESAATTMKNWRESDLPKAIERICREEGIAFIDLTPALQNEVTNGRTPLNPVWDTHLNADGAKVVGETIAQTIKDRLDHPAQ